MANVFDNAGKRSVLQLPIAATNTTDGVIKAAANGVAYQQVDASMEIDEVFLDFAMSAGVNTDGSGTFGIGIYADGVSLTAAAITVAYSSANPYTSVARSGLSKDSLVDGELLRVDVLSVPGGAATSYPMNVTVRIVGVTY